MNYPDGRDPWAIVYWLSIFILFLVIGGLLS
jgi:hypothetical protein